MDSFQPAVNGTVDVADQLSRYLACRARREFAAEHEAKRAVDSPGAFEARRDRIRERFLARVGGLPDRPPDPALELTGVIEREGYAIELLTFQSHPGFHVTANCYVPAGEGPHPGVLFLCGHVRAAKADPANQRACAELVDNGFVVLAVDPIDQGERLQYRDPDTGDPIVEGGGGVFAHCYAGQQCFYAGASLARYVTHDARCALDHLEARSDVDADRLAVTGASGGGVQAQYLALVDDRLAAAAPCCSVTEREEWLRTGKRVDAEQVVPGAISAGINYDDFVTALAPRPVCVGAARSDEYFPIEGVHETVDRARRAYRRYDAGENLDLIVADEPHCSVYDLGDELFEWFCDRLGDEPYDPVDDPAVLDESTLHCTPTGQVHESFDEERSVVDLLREYVETGSGGSPGGEPADLRQTLVDRFDLDRSAPALHPRVVDRTTADGLTVEHVWFRTERDPDVVVTGVLVASPEAVGAPPGSDRGRPAVVLYEEGTEALPGRTDDLAALARAHGTVLLFDPRGVGAVRHRDVPIPAWQEDYYGIYGTEFKLAYDALLLGSSLFGMRVYDVLRAVEFLRSETGAADVALVGEGIGAYHALYAAVVAGPVERLTLRDLGPGFAEMATSRRYPYDPRLTLYDVAGACDVPQALAALDRTGVTVDREATPPGDDEERSS